MALSGTITRTLTSYHWLKIEWSGSQSVSGNYTTITAKLYIGGSGNINDSMNHTARINIDGTALSGSVNYAVARNQTKLLMTKSKTIYHNADGTKSVSIGGSCDMNLTLSGVWFGAGIAIGPSSYTLNTIPRASSFSVSDFNIGANISISISRASTSFTHNFSMYHENNDFIGEWLTKVGTSTTLVLNTTHQDRIYQKIPNANSIKVKITCRTYNGDTYIGAAYKTVTASVGSDIVPTFTTITHSEYVSNVNTIVGKYVQGLSRLSLAITGAAGAYSSTIKSYAITFNGTTTNTKTQTSGIIKSSGNLTITGKVTDSRGRTTSKNVTVNVLPYASPKITGFSLQRCNADGTPDVMGEYVKVTRTGSVSSLINVTEKNTLTYRIKTKAREDSTWATKKEQTITGISLTGSDIIGGYLATTSYDFRLEITDKFKTSVAINTLPTAEVPMSWGKTGIGVGKIWEQGALDVGGDIYVNNALAGHIVETGSNANGNYLRFSDGTQICWKITEVPGTSWTSAPWGGQYKNSITSLPVSFIGDPTPIYSNQDGQIGGRGSWAINVIMSGASAVSIWLGALGSNTASVVGDLMVIGRWK